MHLYISTLAYDLDMLMDDDDIIAQGVADAALRWFASSNECRRKIPASHWTVFASIVVVSTPCASSSATDTQEPPTFRVLTAATGTKCLGQRDLHASGLVVNDCHAEALARRALVRYLYAEALAWRSGSVDTNASLFERYATTQRLVLKPQHALHLYISEAPCGDAAIYELRDDVVDALVKQRVERTAVLDGTAAGASQDLERSALRLTGAKAKRKRDEHDQDLQSRPHKHESQGARTESRFEQRVGVARVKSGRSDLPPDKQTRSMSCSDKLAKWRVLGVQGTLLLQFYESLTLSGVVVRHDRASVSVDAQLAALQRAVVDRCVHIKHLSSCDVRVVSSDGAVSFDRERTPERAASPLALHWTCSESHWRSARAPQGGDGEQQLVRRLFESSDVEVLMAATGLKQGAKKIGAMREHETLRVASHLTKRAFFLAFQALASAHPTGSSSDDGERTDAPQAGATSLPYADQKIAVLASLTARHTPSQSADQAAGSNARHESAEDMRDQFFRAIERWVGVPAAYKQFTVPLARSCPAPAGQ